MKKKVRVWWLTGAACFLGLIVGLFIPPLINKLNHSLYKRDVLEKMMEEYLGGVNIKDALTDELLIVAYDYNS